MNPEIKKRWVADLRAGKYGQARNYLAYGDGEFNLGVESACCLGFLCEIAVADNVVTRELLNEERPAGPFLYGTEPDERSYSDDDDDNWYDEAENASDTLLPRAVIEWAALDSDDPHVMIVPNEHPHVDWEHIRNNSDPAGKAKPMDRPSQYALSVLNDHGMTLEQIADLIEEQL